MPMQGSTIDGAMMARHRTYPVVLRVAGEKALRPHYHRLGTGATMTELLEAITASFPDDFTPTTMRRYVSSMVRFGLLRTQGHGPSTRYLPPDGRRGGD